MRGLEDVKKAIESIGARVVSEDAYIADKAGVDQRFERAEARIRDLEQNLAEASRTKHAAQLAIALAVLGLVGEATVLFINNLTT